MGGSTSVHYYPKEDTELIGKLKGDLERKCKISLNKAIYRHGTSRSPLILICQVDNRDDVTAVNDFIAETRGGNDVCLILVQVVKDGDDTRARLSDTMWLETTQKVGKACLFLYNSDLTTHDYKKNNRKSRKVLKSFLLQRHYSIRTVYYSMVYTAYSHGQEALQFLQKYSYLSLEQVQQEDMSDAIPLIIFCFPDEFFEESEIMGILNRVDWGDVFLVLIRKPYTTFRGTSLKSLARITQLIGGYGTLTLTDSVYTNYLPNMYLIKKVQRFVKQTLKKKN